MFALSAISRWVAISGNKHFSSVITSSGRHWVSAGMKNAWVFHPQNHHMSPINFCIFYRPNTWSVFSAEACNFMHNEERWLVLDSQRISIDSLEYLHTIRFWWQLRNLFLKASKNAKFASGIPFRMQLAESNIKKYLQNVVFLLTCNVHRQNIHKAHNFKNVLLIPNPENFMLQHELVFFFCCWRLMGREKKTRTHSYHPFQFTFCVLDFNWKMF